MKIKVPYIPLLLAFMLVLGIYIGNIIRNKSEIAQPSFIYPRSEKIDEVMNYITHQYVDKVNKEKLEEAAIYALLDSLDPHSVYIPAAELKAVNEPLEGKFSGIGVQFNMQSDTVIVIKTIPNGPSVKIGILAGDRIIKINDTIYAGKKYSTDLIVSKLKGIKGTKVKVGIQRRGSKDLIDFVITRDDIPLYSVDISYMLNKESGYIKISNFSRTTYDEFVDAVKKLQGLGMKKLVLDLRGNGGGYMSSAVYIADEFLEKGKLIVYTEGKNSPREEMYATNKGRLHNTKVGILMDEWSASASEILAGAIQDNDRGKIIGRRSFGKGLVQQPFNLNDGSELRLTIARYYTPTGRSIQKPYINGDKDDYLKDFYERWEKGEFFNKDSIHFPDSLKFKTPAGNIVYGGGGIMPDIFVAQDTINITRYLSEVTNKGLIYRFSFNYSDKNRQLLTKFKDSKSLENYLDKQNILKQFIEFAIKNGVASNNKEIAKSKTILEIQLKANIARDILDNEGFYPIIKKIDNTLLKGLQYLSN